MSTKPSLNDFSEDKLKKLIRLHERRINSFMESPFSALVRQGRKLLGKFGLSNGDKADDFTSYIDKTYLEAASDRKPKRMDLLIRHLWGGYSSYALNDLLSEYHAGKPDTRAETDLVWEIARWHHYCRKDEEVLSLLSSLDWKSLSRDRQISFLLLEVEALRCLGRTEAVNSALREADERLGNNIDINLLFANALAGSRDADPSRLDQERLGYINRVFRDAGLIEIQKIDENRPLLIGNIVAPVSASLRKSTAKKISVIVPTHNAASTIEYALKSLSNQTWSNLEILVADDNSTDGTIDIVRRLVSADDRIRVIHLDRNYGTYAARNKALELATGDFVTVKDSDDWSHPQKLQTQVEDLLTGNAVANTSYWARVSADLQFSGGVRQRPRFLHQNFSSLMLPTSLAKELGGWDPVLFAGDAEFIARLENIYGAKKVVQIAENALLSLGLNREGSLTQHKATQLLTLYGGARSDYADAWKRWHKAAASNGGFRVASDPSEPRRFPAPPNMLSGAGARHYDVVFVSDFSAGNKHIRFLLQELKTAAAKGSKIGVFHWPAYDTGDLREPCEEVISLIDRFEIEALVYAQRVSAERLVFCLASSFQYLFERVPAINAEQSSLIDPDDPFGIFAGEPSSERESALKNIQLLLGVSPVVWQASRLVEAEPNYMTRVGAGSVKNAVRVPVVFGISLASRQVVADWDRTVTLLRYTLGSILAQTNPDFQVFVCAHDEIDIPEVSDPRVGWILSDQSPPVPGRPEPLRGDKMHKRRIVLSRLDRFKECYFMPLDADDLVNCRLVEFIHRDRHPFGYRFGSGLVLDHSNLAIAPVPGVWSSPFDLVCGSSAMVRFQRPRGMRRPLEKFTAIMTKSHAYWQVSFQEIGRPLGTLPFYGSIYTLNHGNNLSFSAQREADRKQWIIDSIGRNQIPVEEFYSDFPVLRKIVEQAKAPAESPEAVSGQA